MALPAAPELRLPDGFAVRLDPRVRRRDGGTTLLGGAPLRLLRLAPRARALLADDRLVVRDGATAALAAHLLDAGLAHPDLAPAPDATGVTVVIPVKDRPVELARLLAALRSDPVTAELPVVVVDDGSAAPVRTDDAVVVRHGTARGPAAARNAGLRAVRTPFVAFLDSDCVPRPGWLARLLPHLADPRLALVAPRIVALSGEGWLSGYEAVEGALDMGRQAAPVRPLTAVSYVPSAALLGRTAALAGGGFDEAMRVAEDVDLVWRLTGAGWRVRYDPAAEVAHEHPTGTAEWLRRRTFYGTGAALLAARHDGLVSPLVVAPDVAAAVGLAAAGGRRGRAVAAGLLAVRAVRLSRRLARPGERPPLGLAAVLTVRATGVSARAMARAVTRHHWPLAAAAGVLSRAARRRLLGVAVLEGLLAWLPHRHEVGPFRHAAARRLDDLAYGAGLWAGAVRARSAAALLPTRPPRP
ncbi:mycofactocin system glycosyltransferase [Blastococcus fimeti]|nr:mycofactocin system glycosyltransferase [Blastococcus fimeti]